MKILPKNTFGRIGLAFVGVIAVAVIAHAQNWPGQLMGIVDLVGRQLFVPGNPGLVASVSNSLVIVPLDASTVTTGGTAVTALNATHAARGGYLVTVNTAGICVDQQTTAGTATGTPPSTACVLANQPFYLVPNGNPVSVNSSASSVIFSGEGFN